MLPLFKNEKDFQELYRTHFDGVRRVLLTMTGIPSVAEELTQESFLKGWDKLATFSLRSSFKTWIYSIAINVGRDWLRTHKNHQVSKVFESSSLETSTPEQKAVQEALLMVGASERELLVLTYYEGMTLEETAKILNIPVGTVKSRLHTSKSELRVILLKKGFDV